MNYKNLPEETKNKIQAYTISGCAVVLFYLILQHIPAFAFARAVPPLNDADL